MAWGIFDFRDNTWMMNELGKRGWTHRPSAATPYSSWDAAKTDLDQLKSSAFTPAIKPKLLPNDVATTETFRARLAFFDGPARSVD
jgi:hypothetical protein